MEYTPENKEPFDYKLFARMYPNDNGFSRLDPNNEHDCENYTRDYYADKEVSTIEEFVDKLDRLDESS